MKDSLKVLHNAGWIIGAQIAQSLLSLLIGIFIVRYLGPTKYGLLSYVASLVSFVVPIMNLGLSNILVQEFIYYPHKDGQILGTAIVCSLFSSFLCIIGLLLFVSLFDNNDSNVFFVCLLYSTKLIFQAITLIIYWFQAHFLSKISSIICLVAYFLVSLYKIYILINIKSIYWFSLTNSFDFAIIAFLSLIFYYKKGGKRLSVSPKLGFYLFSKSKHYIVSSMMVTIFANTDKIMLKQMINEESTGFYSAAVTCAGVAGFIFSAIIDSFRPYIFEGKKINIETFEHRETYLYSIVIYLSVIISLFITLFSKNIINFLYGSDFTPSILPLQIIVWYTTFSYIGAVRNIWILANNLQYLLWFINLSGALFNIVLNVFLIKMYGVPGAAFASLLTQFFTNVLVGYIISPIRPNNSIILHSLHPKYIFNATLKIKHYIFNN